MTSLARFIPEPQLDQIDHVDVGAPLARAWDAVRHVDMARSPIVAALFALRTMPDRFRGRTPARSSLRLEDITGASSGFRILDEQSGEAVTVGAIGKVWQPDIEYTDVPATNFATFNAAGWVKVAWELRCEPRGEAVTRIIVELRVTATDEASWRRFAQYFRLIGPFSHFIRRHMLGLLARELGSPQKAESGQPLPGDELLADAAGEATDGITIAARPADIWPWLVQMGCRRAGWYSWDILDNASVPSASEIVPELQSLHIGDILPATPEGEDGFEVLVLDPPRALVLGGLYDVDSGRQLRFDAPRPPRYWHVTWAFVLEPIDDSRTRLHVRARVAFAPTGLNFRALVAPLIHHFMETEQLRNLRKRVEALQSSAL